MSNFSGSGNTYTATFTPTSGLASGSGTISVASGAFTDAANNPNADGGETNNTTTITYNTLPQQVEIDFAKTDALVYREEFNTFNSSSGLATNWTVTGKNTSTSAAYTLSANTPAGFSSSDSQVSQTLSANDTTEYFLRLGNAATTNTTASTYTFTSQTGTFNALNFSYAALDANATVNFYDASGTLVDSATITSGSGFFSHTLASGVLASSYTISTPSSRYFYVDKLEADVAQNIVVTTATIRDTTPVLLGDYLYALSAGDVIKVYEGTTWLGDAIVDPTTKTWTLPLTTALTTGSHNFVAKIQAPVRWWTIPRSLT